MRKGYFFLLASLLCFGCSTVPRHGFPSEWTFDDTPELRAAHAQLEGKHMPPLHVTGWVNGEVSPADMKGKVVLVDFYATWCGPCMATIPHNNELLEKYQKQGLVIAAVCTSKRGQEKMEAVVQQKGIKYPTARDPDLATEKAWNVRYYPTYAVVDRKGVVRALGLTPDHVEDVITQLLAE